MSGLAAVAVRGLIANPARHHGEPGAGGAALDDWVGAGAIFNLTGSGYTCWIQTPNGWARGRDPSA